MSARHIEAHEIYHDEPIYFLTTDGKRRKLPAVYLWGEVQYVHFEQMVKAIDGSMRSFLKRANKDELFLFEFASGTSSPSGLYMNIHEVHEMLFNSRAKGARSLQCMLGDILVDRFMRAMKKRQKDGETHFQTAAKSFNEFMKNYNNDDVDRLTAFLDDDGAQS